MPWSASRDPVVQQQWRERVERFEASGLSAKAFCAREGFGVESLRRWRRWLGRQAAEVPALVEVRVREVAPPPPPRDAMVVELAQGRRLVLEPGFDPGAVARLVATLERL
jgi:hypothetical protein